MKDGFAEGFEVGFKAGLAAAAAEQKKNYGNQRKTKDSNRR